MSKLKDIVIEHNVKVRQLQEAALERIEGAAKAARSLSTLKAQIQMALEALAEGKAQSDSRYQQQIARYERRNG